MIASTHRRGVLRGIASLAATAALSATAQTRRPRRIGWLEDGGPDTPEVPKQLDDALAKVGWVVGKDIAIDRHPGSLDLPRAAHELVAAKVDVIIISGTPATLAAKMAASEIPS